MYLINSHHWFDQSSNKLLPATGTRDPFSDPSPAIIIQQLIHTPALQRLQQRGIYMNVSASSSNKTAL
jgi:hypothetical protein